MTLQAGEATERAHRTIRRIVVELFWLRAEQVALRELGRNDHLGVDFFRVAYIGIQGDRLIRLIRVLDDHPDAASFWYLNRTVPSAVQQAVAGTPVTLAEIQALSDRIKLIRDKVFVHIDKDGVFEPDRFYAEANVTRQETDRIVEALWQVTNNLYVKATGNEFRREPDYTGADIKELHRFYLSTVAAGRSQSADTTK